MAASRLSNAKVPVVSKPTHPSREHSQQGRARGCSSPDGSFVLCWTSGTMGEPQFDEGQDLRLEVARLEGEVRALRGVWACARSPRCQLAVRGTVVPAVGQ